ncbi:MAG: hypothetical protein IPM82_31055 [Saprospiraceae bacterium]|nr:hypothetical protein [Saprospiraceae bacterium]
MKRTEPNNGDAVVATVTGYTWLTEFTLNYDRTIAKRHAVNALVGSSFQGFSARNACSHFALDFPDNRTGWHNLGSALNPQPAATGELTWGIVSYLGRVNYTFDNKFLLTLTGRVDGASRLGQTTNTAFSPLAPSPGSCTKRILSKTSACFT